jgi:signal transduction histidine kinase/ActR/RegA family two-component response regulator
MNTQNMKAMCHQGGALETDNHLRRRAAEESVSASAASKAETMVGQADLLASEAAFAFLRAETVDDHADVLASQTMNADPLILAYELGQARVVAQRINETKSLFLVRIGHGIRTQLNSILGCAQLLRLNGDLNGVQSAQVSTIQRAGTNLPEMLEDVLALVEIETGRLELRLAEVDLRDLAEACLDFIRPMTEEKNLGLGISVALDISRHLKTDPRRLRQALVNLFGNAVKFTREGAVTLNIRMAGEGASLRIEVIDTGSGTAAEDRQWLFQDFERLDPACTADKARFGLAYSARLAVLMRGRLGHNDKSAGGSVFWLELSLTIVGASQPSATPACDRRTMSSLRRNLHVLVVDDVFMNRDIATSFLRRGGHTVVCAENGAEAIAAVLTEDFDVVLMDVRMPVMDGLEATRQIRALDKGRGQVPIIAVTSQILGEQIAECIAAGMGGHLGKPFGFEELLEAVARAA